MKLQRHTHYSSGVTWNREKATNEKTNLKNYEKLWYYSHTRNVNWNWNAFQVMMMMTFFSSFFWLHVPLTWSHTLIARKRKSIYLAIAAWCTADKTCNYTVSFNSHINENLFMKIWNLLKWNSRTRTSNCLYEKKNISHTYTIHHIVSFYFRGKVKVFFYPRNTSIWL